MKGETTKVLERTLDILRQLAVDPDGMTLTDLSTAIGLPVSTTRRFLITLARKGFVELDAPSERYRLGLAVLGLSTTIQRNNELVQAAQPVLEWLRDQTNETASVRVQAGDQSLVVAVAESGHLVRFVHPIGEQTPLHAGASGKVLLAFMPRAEFDSTLRRMDLKALTSQTIIDRADLLAEVATVRERGFAISMFEVTREAAAVAAPIWDESGHVLGTVAITCPSTRASSEQLEGYAALAGEAARRISERLAPARRGRARPKTAFSDTLQHQMP